MLILFQLLKDLGFKKRRSVPLLRSLSYHLMRNREELDLRTISDCLFALKQLSFKDSVIVLLFPEKQRQTSSVVEVWVFLPDAKPIH